MSESVVEELRLRVSAHPGLVLEEDEQEELAAEVGDLGALVQAHARDAEILVLCTYLLRKLGRFAEAHAAAATALGLGREFAPLTAAATVYRAEERIDEAVKLFDEAATLDPTDLSALMECGKMLGQAERFPEAEERFGRAAARDPDDEEAPVWHIYAAYASAEPADEERHRARMRQFVEEHPDNELAEELLSNMGG